MRSYNPKEWSKIVLDFHRSDTLRKLIPILIGMAMYVWIISYAELHFVNDKWKEHLKNISIIHTLLGFVISMLMVFRTNTAYDRWWEGRKLWGALVNNSRNLALKMSALISKEDKNERAFFCELIPRFAAELKNHLQADSVRYSLDQFDHPEIPNFDRYKHVPEQIVRTITERIIQLQSQQKITGEQLLFINPEITSFMDICGACERIKNTPIPFSYSSFIKKFFLFYALTLPLGYVFSLGYFIIPVVVFILYVLASLELIAEEIEEPFGTDENDLPMDRIIQTITKNVEDILV